MDKVRFIMIFWIVSWAAFASGHGDVIRAREEAINALRGFNPAAVIDGYTPSPEASRLHPEEGSNALQTQGMQAVQSNRELREIWNQTISRPKLRPNPDSKELLYAEALLENPDAILEGTCHTVKGHCEPKITEKTCEESLSFHPESCREDLNVSIQTISKAFTRIVRTSRSQSLTLDLASCPSGDRQCTKANTFPLIQPCEAMKVSIKYRKKPLEIIKNPGCTDTTVTFKLAGGSGSSVSLEVSATESVSQDNWNHTACQKIQVPNAGGFCILEASQSCLFPDAVRMKDGLSIQRACWGREHHYQCATPDKSTCLSHIKEGCSQTASKCIQTREGRCVEFAQVFQCMENFCMPEKTICPGSIGCADGSCDESKAEVSSDMGEGLSHLGALGGVAGDVASKQVPDGTPGIFTGAAQECKKYPLGFRDCCTDSGWGDWIKHCPHDLQVLQKARQENRVVYLGHYKNHKLGSRHYAYCVFPTQLAAIIQIQGRGSQLRISFGNPEFPNCRGLKPEELERIRFDALNLSAIEQDFIKRMVLPSGSQVHASNQAHIEKLYSEGKPQ